VASRGPVQLSFIIRFKGLSGEVNDRSAKHEISLIYGTQRSAIFTNISYPEPIQSCPDTNIRFFKINFITVLPFMPRSPMLSLPFSFFDQNVQCISHFTPYVLHTHSTRPPWFFNLNNICRRIKFKKLFSAMNFLQSSDLPLLPSNLLLSTLFPNTPICVLFSGQGAKFHIYTKQQLKL
jgi:hypothetical protein